MLREIEEFYHPNDGNDWSPAMERALHSFLPDDRGFTLLFGPREYNFSQTIRLIRGMSLIGSGSAKNFSSSILQFPAGMSGIECVFPDPSAPGDRGDQSIIERLYLFGNPNPPPVPGPADPCRTTGGHGIVMNVTTILRDVAVEGFNGDGIHICANHCFKPPSTEEAEADVGPHRLWFPVGFLLGDRRIGRVRLDTAFDPPPVSHAPAPPGGWKKGDRLLNSDPRPGDGYRSFSGWICTAAGDPGEWHGFGAISPEKITAQTGALQTDAETA